MMLVIHNVTQWLFPHKIPHFAEKVTLSPEVIISILFLLAILVVSVFINYESEKFSCKKLPHIWYCALGFVLIYTFFIICSATILKYDTIGEWLLSPIYVFVMFAIFVGIDATLSLLKIAMKDKYLSDLIIIGCVSFWLIYPLSGIYKKTLSYVRGGSGGYNTDYWREAAIIKGLKTNPLDGTIYSDEPWGIYILSGLPARLLPFKDSDVQLFKKSISSGEKNYLVIFKNISPNKINNCYGIQVVRYADFPKAKIYLCKDKT